MIASDFACAALGGDGKADGEAGGNAQGAGVADDDGVKIGTVAAAFFTRIVDVAAAPAFAALIVFDGGDNVVVNSAGFFEIAMSACRGDYFFGPGADLAVNGNEAVGLEILGECSGVFVGRGSGIG